VTPWGEQYLNDLFVVSWLGMTPNHIDSHVYVLRGDGGLLLIDCGTPWGYLRLRQHAEHWGLDLGTTRTILLTHGHVDHARGGYLFKRRGVEILAHPAAAQLAEAEWVHCIQVEGSREACRVDGPLGEGDVVERCGFLVRVFHTPGHTAGCLSYLVSVDGEPCLFTGDLVMSNGHPGWKGDPGHSREQILANLHRLLAVDFRHLCHGHDVRMNDGGELFRAAIAKAGSGEW
jgi:glyoxylase-like metal-dependent hydrolase (beta-lactamase superfamily II)